MRGRRKKRKQQAEADAEGLRGVMQAITAKPHWIMFSAEFDDLDVARESLERLTFFNHGRFVPGMGGVGFFPHRKGTTVVMGGDLTMWEINEIAAMFMRRGSSWDMRYDNRDSEVEERTKMCRDLASMGVGFQPVAEDS